MTDLTGLIDALDIASSTWLDPGADEGLCLRELLSTAAPSWPAAWDQRTTTAGVMLFPLLYGDRPQITTAAFHHLLDAAREAERSRSRMVLVSVPATRRGPHAEAGDRVGRIAEVFTNHGMPVVAGGDVAELDSAPHLVRRACTTRYTRRAVDLPDLLTATAADVLGAREVMLADGLAPGEHLKSRRLLVPLSRLHDRADPFAEPPPGAKKPPAGSDALWASAFTLALTSSANPDDDRERYIAALGRQIGPLWHHLRRADLTGHHGAPPPAEPLRIRAGDHIRGKPVAVPLFGAPAIADGTRTLVAAAALAGPVTLVIDDLTPRFCYRTYPAEEARARYQRLAADHDGQARFLTDLPGLADLIEAALDRLTHADLRKAVGPRTTRRRGALTGFDAVHLAVMGVCCNATQAATLAVKSSNASSVHILARLGTARRLLTCTGTGEVATGDLRVPVHWITHTSGVHL